MARPDVDTFWVFAHVVGAALWLGGLVTLAVAVIVASRTLGRDDFRRFVRAAGRSFAVLAIAAALLLAVSGTVLAATHLHSWAGLRDTAFGRQLETKISIGIGVALATALHVVTGRRTGSRPAIVVSRLLAVAVFAGSLAMVWIGVELAG